MLITAVAALGVFPVSAQMRRGGVASLLDAQAGSAGVDMEGGAQQEAEDVAVWASLGLGGSALGLAYDASLNLMHRKYVFAIDAWGSSGKQLFSMFGQNAWTNFGSYNLTVSRVIVGNDANALVSAGAGISLSSMTYRNAVPGTGGFLSGPDLDRTTVRMIGVPLLLRFNAPICSTLGLDLALRADLNQERSLFAILMGLRMGRIRCSSDLSP